MLSISSQYSCVSVWGYLLLSLLIIVFFIKCVCVSWPFAPFLLLCRPSRSQSSVITARLRFCVITLMHASWSAHIMFYLLALPRAHHVVSKSGLFLAPIHLYLKSPSQTCDFGGLSWNPPDFQQHRPGVRPRVRPRFEPVVALHCHEMVCSVVTCQWFGGGWYFRNWSQLCMIFVGHRVSLYWQLETKALGEGLISFSPPALQPIFLCCGCLSAQHCVNCTSKYHSSSVECYLDLTKIPPFHYPIIRQSYSMWINL